MNGENKMKETLKKLMELKFETDCLVAKIESDSKEKAEKIRAQRTETLVDVVNDLCMLYQIAKEFKLTENGGFYRLETPIKSVAYQGYELEVILYDNCPHSFKISARKEEGYLIGWMGYDKEWKLCKEKGFPLSLDDNLSPYSKEVLNLINEWRNSYQEIENGLILECNNVIKNKLEKANRLL